MDAAEIRRMARDVVTEAMVEAAQGDIDALSWLTSGYIAKTWLEMAAVSRLDVFRWIIFDCSRILVFSQREREANHADKA